MRLAFYHRLGRAWDGESVEREPLGGTQTALTYFSRILAELGHEAHVFGEPAHPRLCAGVPYHPFSQLPAFLRRAPVDVLVNVASDMRIHRLRLPAPLSVYWSHTAHGDLAVGEAPDLRAIQAEQYACLVDKVITVSHWHTQHLRSLFGLPESHVWTSRNGIDPRVLPDRVPGVPPPRLVYASAPDRGLDVLLEFLPQIRSVVPQTELIVASPFSSWWMPEAWVRQQEARLRQRAADVGATWLSGLAKPDLYALLACARVMAYPFHPSPVTRFVAETSCLAAMEAQAMGVPVVTSDLGALPETVAHGVSGWIVPGSLRDRAGAEAFIARVISLLTDDAMWQRFSDQASARIRREFDWRDVAREFINAVGVWQEGPSTRLATPPLGPLLPPPAFTVVVACQDQAEGVRDTLISLLDQPGGPIEVLVCDDGSTDPTFEVAHSFTDRLNLRFFFQPGLGLAAARNMGLQLARGNGILFLNAGQAVRPGDLQSHWLAVTRGGVAGASRPHEASGSPELAVVSFLTRDLVALGGFDLPDRPTGLSTLTQRMEKKGLHWVSVAPPP